MLRLAVDGLAGFSRAPLKLAVVFACVGIAIAVAVVAWALVAFASGRVQPGWTSLALIMLFFGVTQLGCLAIIGAYLGRIYMQLKGRPLFLINEVVGGEHARDA